MAESGRVLMKIRAKNAMDFWIAAGRGCKSMRHVEDRVVVRVSEARSLVYLHRCFQE
jgi:hypothetical protein